MTQEEKELLLKYLCMALPYGVKIMFSSNEFHWDCEQTLYEIRQCTDGEYAINSWIIHGIKPYLRPLSSMTNEEKDEMHNLLSPEGTAIYENDGIALPLNHCGEFVPYEFMNRIIQYLLKHHFDFMGLIPKDLAIIVTEENNPYKE